MGKTAVIFLLVHLSITNTWTEDPQPLDDVQHPSGVGPQVLPGTEGPPIIFVPSQLALPFLEEGLRFFKGLLDITLVRNTRRGGCPPHLSNHVIQPDEFEEALDVYKPGSNRVYIISHHTATRLFMSKRRLQDEEDPPTSLQPGQFFRKGVLYQIKQRILSTTFNLLIVDEAHVLRNPKNILCNLLKGMHSRAVVASTATPLQNKVQDILGYLTLIAKHPGIQFPLHEETTTAQYRTALNERYPPMEIYSHPDNFRLRQDDRLWFMHPEVVARYAFIFGWGSEEVSQRLLVDIMTFIQLRRTGTTSLQLPDGTFEWPRANLLPVTVTTEYLVFPPDVCSQAATIANTLLPGLRKDTDQSGGGSSTSPNQELFIQAPPSDAFSRFRTAQRANLDPALVANIHVPNQFQAPAEVQNGPEIVRMISTSPILARVFVACLHHAQRNEKAIFMMDSPFVRQ